MSHFPNTVIYMNLVMYLIRVSEEEPEQQVRLKFIVSPLVGLKAIKSEHSCWVAELRLSPTSRCRASGCRSCETSYPPAWHLCRLSSPWQHGGEARKGEGVPVNKEWGKQRKGRVGNEEKRNRDWFWTPHPSRVINFRLRTEWWTFFRLLVASSPTHQALLWGVITSDNNGCTLTSPCYVWNTVEWLRAVWKILVISCQLWLAHVCPMCLHYELYRNH